MAAAYPVVPIIFLFIFCRTTAVGSSSLSVEKSCPSSSATSPLHIFLSFRGADTRENIASLVYDALYREGFNVFMDEETIRTGQDIDLVIREAINNSMGAVVIFSKNFASSEWCLEELVLILDRKKMLGSHYVLQPIYVDGVDPDDIAEQRGCYADALLKHRNRYSYWSWNWIQKWNWNNKVNLWNAALMEVVRYKGRILSGKWANFINEMVEDIRQEFIVVLGVTVKPRPQYNTISTSQMDHRSAGRLDTLYEFLKKLAIIVRFVHQNQWLVNVFIRNSCHDHLLVQEEAQVDTAAPVDTKNMNIELMAPPAGSRLGAGVWECPIVSICCIFVILYGCMIILNIIEPE